MSDKRNGSSTSRAGDLQDVADTSLSTNTIRHLGQRADEDWRGWLGNAPAQPADPAVEIDSVSDESPSTWSVDTNAPGSAGSLDQYADPMAPLKEDLLRRQQSQQRRRKTLRTTGTIAACLTVLGAAAVAAYAAIPHSDNTPRQTSTLVPATTAAAAAAPPWCQTVNTPTLVVGDGRGDQVTAQGVILWQQYAMYVDRNADAVRSVLAPDAAAAPIDATRAAIAAIPAQTRHCVTITSLAPDRWAVQIDERHPDGTSAQWQQVATTANRDGREVITSITAGDK